MALGFRRGDGRGGEGAGELTGVPAWLSQLQAAPISHHSELEFPEDEWLQEVTPVLHRSMSKIVIFCFNGGKGEILCLFIHAFIYPSNIYVLGARVETAKDPSGFSSPTGR